MKKFTTNKRIYRLLGIVLFIIAWQLLSLIVGEETFIFPGPFKTIVEAIKMLGDSYIYKCIAQTLVRMFGGFVISFILAFVIGVFAGNNHKFEEILKPTIIIFRSVPTATLVYLFLVLAGARLTPLLIVVLVSFPIIYEAVVAGIKSTPDDLIKAAQIDAATNLSINMDVRIPLAIPYILVGVASSFSLSLKIEIMAEVITGYTRLGLGSAILAAQRSDPTNMVPIFAYSFVAIVLMLVFEEIANVIVKKFHK